MGGLLGGGNLRSLSHFPKVQLKRKTAMGGDRRGSVGFRTFLNSAGSEDRGEEHRGSF